MALINLVIGDWSNDGHGKTDEIMYEVSVSEKELKESFIKGSEIMEFDLTKECENYEDGYLSEDTCQKIKQHFPDSELSEYIKENEERSYQTPMDSESFANLYMEIAKLGNTNIVYSLASHEEVRIGGYGLFE